MEVPMRLLLCLLLLAPAAFAQDGKDDVDKGREPGEFGPLDAIPIPGTITGVVKDDESGEPIADISIDQVLLGKDASGRTDDKGVFSVKSSSKVVQMLRVAADGYASVIHYQVWWPGEKKDGTIEVYLPTADEEAKAYAEDYGGKQETGTGTVVVRFMDARDLNKVFVGASADLEVPKVTAYVVGKGGKVSKGNEVKSGAESAEVVYPNVAAGEYSLTNKAPDGYDCWGPDKVVVDVGWTTMAVFFCEKPEA
jgi:hypothetical protein